MTTTSFVAFLLMLDVPGSPTLGSHTIDLTANQFAYYSSTIEGCGPYYVMQLQLPPGVVAAQQAWIDVYMDVSSRELEGWLDPAPTLEVYELDGALAGEPSPSDFVPTEVPTARPVAAGENRHLRIDITNIVRRLIQNPGGGHGIILGSLTNERVGLFDLNGGVLGPGIVARVTILM